jgi:cell division protein FtsI (penicillin-binding protein 3)
VREMLEMVTVEGGTAQEASIEGNTVAGKTGTAQIFDREKRRYSHERFMSSFVGFFPSNKPRLAMIVVISEPKGQTFGGLVAAPAFKEIAEQALAYLNVPRDDSSMQNVIHVSAQNEAKRYY